ncbi:hypothetical protein, partial [Vibrio cholerae]|uniref:hypothetical protein n=1 Tax=Vibrio cholerae TaxID=666 RepID=UPI003B523D53
MELTSHLLNSAAFDSVSVSEVDLTAQLIDKAPVFSMSYIAPLYAEELASVFPYLGFANDGEVPRHKSLCQTG